MAKKDKTIQMSFEERKLKQILSKYVELNSQLFSVGELTMEPDKQGCFQLFGKWFVYKSDEHAFFDIRGPFDVDSAICAALKILYIRNEEAQWNSEEDRSVFINNHFRDVAEIADYMYAHRNHCPYLIYAPTPYPQKYECDICGSLFLSHEIPTSCFCNYDDCGLRNGSIQRGRL